MAYRPKKGCSLLFDIKDKDIKLFLCSYYNKENKPIHNNSRIFFFNIGCTRSGNLRQRLHHKAAFVHQRVEAASIRGVSSTRSPYKKQVDINHPIAIDPAYRLMRTPYLAFYLG